MESGVKIVDEETKSTVGDGASQAVSVGGDAGDSPKLMDEAKDAEENEVFEEAMDTPKESFFTPHHRDSRDFMFRRGGLFEDVNEEPRSVKKFDELIDATVNGESPEEGGAIGFAETDEQADVEVNDLGPEEHEVVVKEKLEELPDALVDAPSPGGQEVVVSEKLAQVNAQRSEGQETIVLEKFDESFDAQADTQRSEGHETVVLEKFGESLDAQVNAQRFEGQEAVFLEEFDESLDAQADAQRSEGQEAVVLERFNESLNAQVNAQRSEGHGMVSSKGKIETPNESVRAPEEQAEVEVDGVTGKGVGDVEGDPSLLADGGENIAEYSGKELIGEKSENGDSNEVNSDGLHSFVPENPENGESHETGSKESTTHEDGVPQKQNVPVILDVPSDKQERELQTEGVHPSENLTETDNRIEAETSASVNGGERIAEYSDKEIIEQKFENGESNEVNSDGPHFFVSEKPENGESDETRSKESIPKQDLPVILDVPSDKQARELHTKDVHPSENLAETDNGIEVKTSASVAKEGGIQEPLTQVGGQIPIPDSKSTDRKELEKESVLVEDLGESSSSDDDDSRIPSQLAPSGNLRPTNTNLGAPTLPSRPTGLGSSVPAGAPTLPYRPTGLGSSAPVGAPSLPSHPAGIGSSPSVGAPSLPSRPAGLGSSAPLLEPATRSLQQPRVNGSVPQRQSHPSDELANDDSEENDETREKLQMIRVKFLRLAHRLGQTPHNVVVAQVLYRLGLAEQLSRNTNRPGVFSFDRASVMAEQLEMAGQEPLDFSCTIMVIGKTGVGKSATINSIFDEVKFHTNAFQPSTKKVQEIVGTVQGIKVRVIDMPGLFASSSDQRRNEKILYSVKRFISKTPPDIILYFDRLDMQSRDFGDVPLLRTITDVFGSSIWFNAIIVLTHAASAPPDGPNGTPLSYEMFVTQRSHVVQQAIRQAAGDVRLMNPVSLVENHSACRMNRAGQRVLPNGQVWKPQLLLLSFASKILAEANMLLKLQDSPTGKPFGSRARVPPLPFLLTSLLQSRPQLKLPEEQFGNEDAMDEDLDEASDSDGGSDYDELPPFKNLTKAQLEKLSKAQKAAYFEELDYREKLFFRKQLKEGKKRRKLMKKMAEAAKDLPNDYSNENLEDESSGPASVPVPMPDYVLPASFDSDNPGHRYRFLDSSSQWFVRPVLDSQGWDHDVGYEGLNIERLFVVKDKIPLSVSGQLTKDKKELNLQMEAASSIKHGEGKATSLGLDMQTIGKDMAYTLRGETRFKNFRRNNTAAGLSVTILGDSVSAGMKIEDTLIISKTFRLLMSGGAMTGRGDVAYGGRLEATLRDKDYPVGRMLSTLALSVMDWRGDLALGCNVQSQIPFGRGTNLIGHANLSNKGSGQVGIRLNSSEHLQIALLALVPIFRNVKRMLSGSSQSM